MARVCQTDGVLPKAAKDCYQEFLVATRKYQFLKMCMRKGIQPSGSLVYGSLTKMCPACPHIAINICQEWSTRTEDKQYLDALYHAVDDNFTQNTKDKGSDEHDLPLMLGSAYFANEHDAKQYFAAMPPPKTEFGAMGYYGHWRLVSGLVGLSCARHMFLLPGGGVDLKVGDPWAAVDFLMLSGLQNWMRLKLHISAYNINSAHLTKKFCEAKRYQSESSVYLAELATEIMGSGLPADILEVWATTKRNWDQHLIDVGKPTESVPPSRQALTTLLCPYEALKSNAATQQGRHKSLKARSTEDVLKLVGLLDIIREGIELQELMACLILQLLRKSSGWTDEKIAEIQEGFSKRVGVWSKAADSSLQTPMAVAMDSLSQERRVAVYKEVRTKNASLADGSRTTQADNNNDDDEPLSSPS
ncbi:hypothetical protein BC835DRAFT_1411424 [Cytidiella melzeri]|nr:hypothetical protein BC835DRAFT_1411424 [Cytidiella melzeri]